MSGHIFAALWERCWTCKAARREVEDCPWFCGSPVPKSVLKRRAAESESVQ